MFAAHELALGISFRAAQTRLLNMAQGDSLSGPSRNMYDDGLARLIRVGPLGGAPGLSKLVRVRCLDPVYRDGAMTLGLRWEATGAAGGLFPVLDADITLTPAGEHATRLSMSGSYRPPFGRVGATLDRAVLHQVATATIRALLNQIADMLASPGPAASHRAPTVTDPATQPLPEPGAPT